MLKILHKFPKVVFLGVAIESVKGGLVTHDQNNF
jgi:hypothetical protein